MAMMLMVLRNDFVDRNTLIKLHATDLTDLIAQLRVKIRPGKLDLGEAVGLTVLKPGHTEEANRENLVFVADLSQVPAKSKVQLWAVATDAPPEGVPPGGRPPTISGAGQPIAINTLLAAESWDEIHSPHSVISAESTSSSSEGWEVVSRNSSNSSDADARRPLGAPSVTPAVAMEAADRLQPADANTGNTLTDSGDSVPPPAHAAPAPLVVDMAHSSFQLHIWAAQAQVTAMWPPVATVRAQKNLGYKITASGKNYKVVTTAGKQTSVY